MSTARLLEIKNPAPTQYTHRGVDTGVAGGGVRTTELLFADPEMQKSEFVLHAPPPLPPTHTHRMASLTVSHLVWGEDGVMEMFGIRGKVWSSSVRVASPVSSSIW